MGSNLFVAIATAGRRDVLTATLDELSRQTRLPDIVYVAPASAQDVDDAAIARSKLKIEIVSAPLGACVQRNAILDRLRHYEDGVVLILDDDFFPAPNYLAEAEHLFSANPDIVIASGLVHADGAPGPGLTVDGARQLLIERFDANCESRTEPLYNGYGCNMVVRLSAVQRLGVRFDETLPLYAWLEDVDFSRQLASAGQIVWCNRLQGVHLGSKKGRSPGKRLGYSQIANPWYLFRKRTLSPRRAATQVGRNVAANLLRSMSPEPWVDRRGRLYGNLLAMADLVRGRLSPLNVRTFR